jgi:hypothetical protein
MREVAEAIIMTHQAVLQESAEFSEADVRREEVA